MLTRVKGSKETRSTTVVRDGGGGKTDLVGLEPEALLEDLVRLFRFARGRVGRARCELYHRAALRRRVRAGEADGHLVLESGRDEGLAVRVVDSRGNVGFASVSENSEEALGWALHEARRSPLGNVDHGQPWAAGAGKVEEDLDLPVELPSAGVLGGWLRRALARLGVDPPGEGRSPRGGSWVEFGCTVESIVAEGGLKACRARSRAWAMTHRPMPGGERGEERPHMLAARSLDDLLDQDWIRPGPLPGGPPLSLEDAVKLRFFLEPQAASVLVRSLVRTLFTYGQRLRVGAGLDLADDPCHPLGLVGGRFDDAGFPAGRKRLADGERLIHRIEGRGHLRRLSFRDPPRPHATVLVVADGRAALPRRAVRISDLRAHPLGPERWMLEVRGALWEKGVAVRPLGFRFVPASPAELMRGCIGGVGRGRLCPNNTVTPGLLFEGMGRG